MGARADGRSAGPATTIVAAAVAVAATLLFAGRVWYAQAGALESLAQTLAWGGAALAFALVGGFVVVRRSHNPVGWLFLFVGATSSLDGFAYSYAQHAIISGRITPLAAAFAWLSTWLALPAIVLIFVSLPLRFPHGRLPAPGWRWVEYAVAAMAVPVLLAEWVNPGPLGPNLPLSNPLGIEAAAVVTQPVFDYGGVALVPVIVAAWSGLAWRYRRSTGVERAQLKWFVSAALLTAAWVVATMVLSAAGDPVSGPLAVLGGLTVVGLPLSAAVAIQRYHLYAIDRIVSRTVGYALLTGLLAGVYVTGTVLVSRLLAPVDAGGDLAVAGATLAVAALFRPARRRIQSAVDRRFDRKRFDAEGTVEGFRARVRDEVQIVQLSADLLATSRATMAPVAASLWLREQAAAR